MTIRCCVPECTSRLTKDSAVSFHEFPNDHELFEAWAEAIVEKGWDPHTKSNIPKVCSKHFLKSDFHLNLKRKRLKPHTLPTIFPGRRLPKKKVGKQAKQSAKQTKQPPEQQATMSPSCKDNNLPEGESFDNESTLSSGSKAELTKPSPEQETTTSSKVNSFFLEGESFGDDSTLPLQPEAWTVTIIPETPPIISKVDTATQVHSFGLVPAERKEWRLKCRNLQRKIYKLQKKCESLTLKLDILKEDSHTVTIQKLVKKAEEDSSAEFLLDQLNHFLKGPPQWSESTLRQCLYLRKLSPTFYEKFRSANLFKLPSSGSMLKYVKDLTFPDEKSQRKDILEIPVNNDSSLEES